MYQNRGSLGVLAPTTKGSASPATPESENFERLAGLVRELPDPYRTVLRVLELDGGTFADAATFLDLREASVRLLYVEGRRRLKAIVLSHSESGSL